jgi:hypothetical protein
VQLLVSSRQQIEAKLKGQIQLLTICQRVNRQFLGETRPFWGLIFLLSFNWILIGFLGLFLNPKS